MSVEDLLSVPYDFIVDVVWEHVIEEGKQIMHQQGTLRKKIQ
jgi:hypothetical protein